MIRRTRRAVHKRAPARRYRRKARRSYTRNKRRGWGNLTSTVRVGTAVPDRYLCKLKYTFQTGFTCQTGANYSFYRFRNSLADVDPDLAGIQQPMYRDQFINLYARYRVLGIGFKLWSQTISSRMVRGMIGITDATQVEANMLSFQQRDGTINFSVPPGGSPPKYITGYYSVGKPWGFSKTQVRSIDDFYALISADPARLTHLYIGYNSFESTTVDFMIELFLYVELSDRVLAVTS